MTNSTQTNATTAAPFPPASPLGRLSSVFEAGGFEYRPSYFGARLHAERWMDEHGTAIQVLSWDGYGSHFVLSVENQSHGFDGSAYATDDGETFEDGARRALAVARRFSTLAQQ